MQKYNYASLDYLQVVKKLIDNVIWTTLDERYSEPGQANPLVESSDWFCRLLKPNTYSISDTGYTFHKPAMVELLKKYTPATELPYPEALLAIKNQKTKQIILQLNLHSQRHNPKAIKTGFFDKLFKKHPELIVNMKKGRLTMLLYFGWEADNFTNNTNHTPSHRNTYYEMFDNVRSKYDLPPKSIIVLSSNKKGYKQEQEFYGEDLKLGNYTRVIYENAYEINSFQEKNKWNPSYTFDEYIANIEKKESKRLLRINRTQLQSRDFMLYWLENTKYIEDSIVEYELGNEENENILFHKTEAQGIEYPGPETIDYHELKYKIRNYFKISTELSYNHLLPFLKFDKKIVGKIKQTSSYVASKIEERYDYTLRNIKDWEYTNKTIPVDVYRNSIFSWVSTSLADRKDQVFINMSTFNPVLHYHPLVFYSNPSHNKYFVESGYKPYDWFTETEKVDKTLNINQKMVLSLYEIDRLMNTPKDSLIGIIKDSRSSLEHNRNFLFECRSIENILKKLYVIMYAENMNSDGIFTDLKDTKLI